jgi:hypothetical protein
MSGSFVRIFSFDGSKKWIMREGGNGIEVTGSGAPAASGLKKSRGLFMGSPEVKAALVACQVGMVTRR